MADYFSRRFAKNVWVSRHARQSMRARDVDDTTLEHVIETGEIKRKDDAHLWIYMHMEGRSDNLVCAAVVESDAIIVKTVMINWELGDET